ncbi:MAG: methylated-DNA--[protein]-cysteine S-methyltransferase [Geodermatophilaceae bacterium]
MTMAWAVVPAPQPIQQLTVAVTDDGVAFVAFGGDADVLATAARRAGRRLVADAAETEDAVDQLGDYLAGRRQAFDLPLDWGLFAATQRIVLGTLYDGVGYGETVTYGELARKSGAFDGDDGVLGARAVGSIMGANPIPVIVPCHRVLAAGGLGGFGGGLAAKRWLLELEGALPPTLDFAG